MFYVLAKTASLVILPSSLGLIAIALGLAAIALKQWHKFGLTLASCGLIFLVIAGFSPLANWILYPLEQRFAHTPLPKPNDDVTGIIILGGFEDPWVTGGRPGLGLNEAAERLTEGVRLARRWPQAKVVFTGGVAGLFPGSKSAASAIGAFLTDVGIDHARLVLEGKSRDTYENALFTRQLIKPKPRDNWVLVTSAFHMPRSVGVFRKVGFNVIPAPVDFRTRDTRDFLRFFSRASQGLLRIDTVAKEWIGLLAYWASGRSTEIFPSPVMEK